MDRVAAVGNEAVFPIVDEIAPLPAVHEVRTILRFQPIDSPTTKDGVLSRSPHDLVVATLSVEEVVAEFALNEIAARSAADEVLAVRTIRPGKPPKQSVSVT
jgi:hypothetical protein